MCKHKNHTQRRFKTATQRKARNFTMSPSETEATENCETKIKFHAKAMGHHFQCKNDNGGRAGEVKRKWEIHKPKHQLPNHTNNNITNKKAQPCRKIIITAELLEHNRLKSSVLKWVVCTFLGGDELTKLTQKLGTEVAILYSNYWHL